MDKPSKLVIIMYMYIEYDFNVPHAEHIEKLENTSITNIHRITLKTRKIVNQHSSVLDDLR